MGVNVNGWGPCNWRLLLALALFIEAQIRALRKLGGAEAPAQVARVAGIWQRANELWAMLCACPICKHSFAAFLREYMRAKGSSLARMAADGGAVRSHWELHNIVDTKLQHQHVAREFVQSCGFSEDDAVRLAGRVRPQGPSMKALRLRLHLSDEHFSVDDVLTSLHALRLDYGAEKRELYVEWMGILTKLVRAEVRMRALGRVHPLFVFSQALEVMAPRMREGAVSAEAFDTWMATLHAMLESGRPQSSEAVEAARKAMHARFDVMLVGHEGCALGTCDDAAVAVRKQDCAAACAAADRAGKDARAIVAAALSQS